MAMARIEKSTSSGYVKLVLEVTETSRNIANNTSDISWQLWLARDQAWVYDLNNESLAEVEINGQYVLSKYVSFDLRNRDWVTFGQGTMTIPHNEDGTKSITIWARLTNIADQGNINWFSGTVTLSNIPRSSAVSSVSAAELGKPITITLDKKISSFRHQVKWRVNGSDWVDLGKGHDTSVQATVPIEYANRITSSTSGLLDVSVRTFDGEKEIGVETTKTGIPIKVPDSIVPTIDEVLTTERTAKIAEFIPKGYFIKDKSVIRLSAKGANGAYGSRIVTTELMLDNLIVRSEEGDFPAVKSGTFEASAKVTDSRGRSAIKTITVNVLDYYAPKINGFIANRAGNGTNKTIISTVLANVCPIMIGGINRNPYTLKIQYSEKKTNRWIDAVNYTNETTERISRQIDCGAFYDLTKPYNIRLYIEDKISDFVDSILAVRSSSVLVALGNGRFSIGGFPELENHFESFLPVAFHKTLNVEEGILSNGKPIQEFMMTDKNGKAIKYSGDLNNLKTVGGYHAFGVQNNPSGTNNYGYINVITHSTDSNYCIQQYVPFNSTVLHLRRLENGKWTEWTNVWKNVSYLNGWQDYGTEYPPVQYKLNNNGSMELRGSCKDGDVTPWRHAFKINFQVEPKKPIFIRGMTKDYKQCTLNVYKSGIVVVVRDVNSEWLCLDGITITN
nr:MAG TPA: protein of unknown function DUF859 [Caudoviricetes sp.]